MERGAWRPGNRNGFFTDSANRQMLCCSAVRTAGQLPVLFPAERRANPRVEAATAAGFGGAGELRGQGAWSWH